MHDITEKINKKIVENMHVINAEINKIVDQNLVINESKSQDNIHVISTTNKQLFYCQLTTTCYSPSVIY